MCKNPKTISKLLEQMIRSGSLLDRDKCRPCSVSSELAKDSGGARSVRGVSVTVSGLSRRIPCAHGRNAFMWKGHYRVVRKRELSSY